MSTAQEGDQRVDNTCCRSGGSGGNLHQHGDVKLLVRNCSSICDGQQDCHVIVEKHMQGLASIRFNWATLHMKLLKKLQGRSRSSLAGKRAAMFDQSRIQGPSVTAQAMTASLKLGRFI